MMLDPSDRRRSATLSRHKAELQTAAVFQEAIIITRTRLGIGATTVAKTLDGLASNIRDSRRERERIAGAGKGAEWWEETEAHYRMREWLRDTERDLFAGKLTWRLSPNHTLTGSVFGDPGERTGPVFAIAGPEITWAGIREFGSTDYVVRYDGTLGNSFLIRIPPGVAHGAKNLRPAAPSTIVYFVDVQFSTDEACDEGRLPWDHFGADVWEVERG